MPQNEDRNEEPLGLGKGRLEAISDGVFAVALTFLMLEVHLPKEHEGESLSSDWLLGLWPKIITFIASFLIVGILWIAHHNECRYIRYTDRWLLWRNLLFLLSVVTVPFSTGVFGEAWQQSNSERWPVWVYAGNLILTSLLLQYFWLSAARGTVYDSEGKGISMLWPWSERYRGATTRRNSYLPVLYGLAVSISFVNSTWSRWLLVAIPPAYVLVPLIEKTLKCDPPVAKSRANETAEP